MGAHVVEEVLLGVAGVGAEVGFYKVFEAFGGGLAFWEVELLDGFLDPDIDGEGVLEAVGEEEDAVGDFFADAGELAEGCAGGGGGEGAEGFEVELACSDDAGGLEEVGGAEAHFAIAQVLFFEGG